MQEFAGTATSRPEPRIQALVEEFVIEQYRDGRSLREIAELTDRSHSAVRNILDKHGVHRRGRGASKQPLTSAPPQNHDERQRGGGSRR
nr:helix-turn-helix domain-containing protein [Modestobacter versicolor]